MSLSNNYKRGRREGMTPKAQELARIYDRRRKLRWSLGARWFGTGYARGFNAALDMVAEEDKIVVLHARNTEPRLVQRGAKTGQ